jgi:hypothetical protein
MSREASPRGAVDWRLNTRDVTYGSEELSNGNGYLQFSVNPWRIPVELKNLAYYPF